MFHTFLLDRNNNVIAIGNPTYNNAVAEMFRAIISGRKTFNNSGTQMIEVKELEPMKIIRYLLIISALILTACQTSTSDKDSFNLSDFKAIKGSRILANAEILNPQNIVTIDSGILLADYHAPYLLQYYKNYNDTNPQCMTLINI
ncbi:MAG: hypothetical protein K2I35_00095 [Duncaniella sp.]|nr:hypothetical protein [Duncaniella sp.]